MNLAFLSLKRILPELNERVISPARIFEVFTERGIEFYELPFRHTNGCYITESGKEYVILKRALSQLLFHETLALEGAHALIHAPAPFLLRKQQLEAETLALVCVMPVTELPRLNRIKHQFDAESYELLMRRNKAHRIWQI